MMTSGYDVTISEILHSISMYYIDPSELRELQVLELLGRVCDGNLDG